MKFQNWSSFEKHLSEAAPDHLSHLYLAVSSCAFERKKIFAQITAGIKGAELFSTESVEQALEALNSPSLFAAATVVILDGLEKLKKKEWEPVLQYAAKPSHHAYLLLGSASSKGLADLYTKGKKELVTLDLSEEKPWDRKARLQRFLVQLALKEGKTLAADAASYLLEQADLDLPALEQEMQKLLCLVGERKAINLEDVKQISSVHKELNSWQLVEAILKNEPVRIDPSFDTNMLFPLIGQIRYQLQKQPHNKEALHQLFEIELLAKNSSYPAPLLLDLFIAHLHHVKKAYPAFTSQFIG